MSDRRRARAAAATSQDGRLPAELAMGPCMEVWAPEPKVSDYLPDGMTPAQLDYVTRWGDARHAWHHALLKWSKDNRIDWRQARQMCRTTSPWSREYLEHDGRGEWVRYYLGQRPDLPIDA